MERGLGYTERIEDMVLTMKKKKTEGYASLFIIWCTCLSVVSSSLDLNTQRTLGGIQPPVVLNRRRVLLETTARTPIHFKVQCPRISLNAAACANETWTDLGNQIWDVSLEAQDPDACWKQVVLALISVRAVVIVPIISQDIPSNNTAAPSNNIPSNNTAAQVNTSMNKNAQDQQEKQPLSLLSIAGIAVGCTVGLIALGFVFVHYNYTSHDELHATHHR